MVDLSTFRRDARAMADGEWVSPGPEYGDLRIRTRALGYAYTDARAAKMKLAARKFGAEDRIPAEERDRILTDCLIDHCLQDVAGLADGGAPVTFAAFCDLIRNPAYGELNNAAFIAANMVGRQSANDVEDAAGNSAPPSGTV